MRSSIQNGNHDQLSRIESLSQAFHGAVEDEGILLQGMAEEQAQALHVFIYGFGFQAERPAFPTSQIGDVFSILTNLETKVEH